MKTKKLRIFSLLLCLVMAFSAIGTTAFATEVDTPVDDPLDPDPYSYISTIYAGLSISSSGYATCSSFCNLYSSSNTCYLSMYLQRSSNGSSGWTTVQGWGTSGYGGASMTKYRYVSSGYYYRVRATATVISASGITREIANINSPVRYY